MTLESVALAWALIVSDGGTPRLVQMFDNQEECRKAAIIEALKKKPASCYRDIDRDEEGYWESTQ